MLICLALLLTSGATYFEWQSLGAAFTAGDVIGPPGYEEQARLAVRKLERQANVDTGGAAFCLILASICLGVGLRRKFKWHPILVFLAAFLICPLVSVLPIAIGIYALNHSSP
jgi:hypothetical protein